MNFSFLFFIFSSIYSPLQRMSSLHYTEQRRRMLEFKNNSLLLLKAFSIDMFPVFLVLVNNSDSNQFSRWLQGQQLNPASCLIKLARRKAENRPEVANFTSSFSVNEQKPLRKLVAKHMGPITRTVKSIRVLENVHHLVLDMSQRVSDELGTLLFIITSEAYLALILKASSRMRREKPISEAVETLSPQTVLLLFHAFHFFNWSKS